MPVCFGEASSHPSVPPAPQRPLGTTHVQYFISAAPPSLLKQGGVSEISGRALRVIY